MPGLVVTHATARTWSVHDDDSSTTTAVVMPRFLLA